MDLHNHVLGVGSNLVLNKTLVKKLGLEHTALLCALIEAEKYAKIKGCIDSSGFFRCKGDYIESIIGITAYKQQKVCSTLEKLGLIATRVVGIPATKHFQLFGENIIKMLLSEDVETPLDTDISPVDNSETDISPVSQNSEASFPEIRKLSSQNSETYKKSNNKEIRGVIKETPQPKNKIKSTMQIVEERLQFNEAQKSLPSLFMLHTWLIRVFKKEEDLQEYLDYILATKAKRETFTHQKTQHNYHENFWYPDFLSFKASGLTLDKFDKTATMQKPKIEDIKPYWREYENPRDYFADCYKLKKNGDLPQNYNIDPPFNAIDMWGIRSDELEKIRVEEQEKIFN
jgi:hypothetical protein